MTDKLPANPEWGEPEDFDAVGDYEKSFGGMADQTRYSDPMNGMTVVRTTAGNLVYYDKRGPKDTLIPFYKATNIGAASNQPGYALKPVVYDPDVVDITRRLTPVQALVPKTTNYGITANYYRLIERAAAQWGPEDPNLNEADDTRKAESADIKFLRTTGRVTGVAQAGGAHFYNALQAEVMAKTQSMNEAIEEELLVGTNTAGFGHDGLLQNLTANQTDLSGAAVTLTDVKELVNDCFVDKGYPNLLITDPYTATALELQMLDYTRTVPVVQFAWGLETLAIQTMLGKLPIIGSQFMPIGANEKRIFCLDTNYLQQRVLVDTTYEDLAKGSDSNKFFMKTYRTLINKFPEGMGQLYGIA